MKTLYVRNVLKPIEGRLMVGNRDHWFNSVVTNTRKLANYTLLFDMRSRFRTNRSYWRKFPSAIVVTDNPGAYKNPLCPWTVIHVRSVKRAYLKFVEYYRSLWNIPVVGVTGTCGKTTVKEMIAHILSAYGNVQATYKSLNGLGNNLKYLTGIDEKTHAAVMELGVGAPDDLLKSCHFFKPDIGIITMIGTDHLEHCGTLENYIRAKAKLLRGMNNKGTLILNYDCINTRKIDISNFKGKIITFGFREGADFHAKEYSYGHGGMTFVFKAKGTTYSAFVPGYGKHNVYNALAALAASQAMNIDMENAIARLSKFKQVERHLQLKRGIKGSTIIDDTWSSNPNSTEAALKVLKEVGKGKHTVAILGKMSLLGSYSRKEHEAIGDLVVKNGIDVLITVDKTAEWIGRRAIQRGMDKSRVYFYHTPEKVYELLKRNLDPNTVVLLKTSMLDRSNVLSEMVVAEADTH